MLVTLAAIVLVWICLAPLLAIITGRLIAEADRPAQRLPEPRGASDDIAASVPRQPSTSPPAPAAS